MPLYIGISLDRDEKVIEKVADVILGGLDKLIKRYGNSYLIELEKHMKRLLLQNYDESQGWKIPFSLHVT